MLKMEDEKKPLNESLTLEIGIMFLIFNPIEKYKQPSSKIIIGV